MTKHQPLNPADHGNLRIDTRADAALGDAVMATLVVPDEFRKAQAHFPILFRKDVATGRFGALALLGFEQGENLFLGNTGWDAGYRPMSLAIQPFLVGMPEGGEGEPQVHVDMDHARIASGGEGVRVFDEQGQATPYLDTVAENLGNLHQGFQDSEGFYGALERHGLLEPFTLTVPLADGSKQSLVGFHIIDEDRLRGLDGDALAELHAEGHLMPLFMALASLSQLSALVARKEDRIARG